MIGLGVMSGSSLDGLDLALVYFSSKGKLKWKLKSYDTIELPRKLKNDLNKIRSCSVKEIALLSSRYSRFISKTINSFIKNSSKADFLSIHGHTVLHYPKQQISWQLLNGGQVAELSNIPLVCDFRNQDLALGGSGTPMAVLADRDLFPGFNYYINFGGIANVSFRSKQTWKALDICPFNQILNHYAQKMNFEFDKDGHLASEGDVQDELMQFLLTHEYILRTPPKALDNEEVVKHWIMPIEALKFSKKDVLRTFLEFTCIHILDRVEEKSKVFATGGGARNKFFISLLKKSLKLKKCQLILPSAKIIDFKEAILMAYAGYRRINGLANFVSSATGAKKDTIAGALYTPSK